MLMEFEILNQLMYFKITSPPIKWATYLSHLNYITCLINISLHTIQTNNK